MAFNSNFTKAGVQSGAGALDAGLRAYMCRVFNWMALGLLITGVVAFGVAETSLRGFFFHAVELSNGSIMLRPTLLEWAAIFSPLLFVMSLSVGINRFSRTAVQGIFLAFSAVMGASMAGILLAYTGVSVARTFFVCSVMFGGMALWGYTTGSNLMRFGSFLIMGVWGIIIASLVNIFLHSSALSLLVSIIGVVLFTALTAYDAQRIKINYQQNLSYASAEDIGKFSIYDALNMYLNFVNLFQFLLQFTGDRNSR
ncbi:Bax inhibitor-1/YccA family protein [Swingsia samuiensis]|uniref:Bax inhibitor-1/YccA family protein n=1 Tax=Swingsia samuiensis TaxID=1293412 RepID=A0A4Y6UNF8_9PROT|nr:Bax inhibitor-1/YccA family protein [Swingsia samuiensis]QDH17595.1 Bax inhibitor-1/YccA family protein [Swingsia samuiensis]